MHRLSPLSKLFVTVLYIVVTVSFHKYDISGVFVMVLFPLAGYQVGMIPVHTCFHKLRVVMPLVCAVGLFNPFFDKRIVLYIGAGGVSGGVISLFMCAHLPVCTKTPIAASPERSLPHGSYLDAWYRDY